MIEQIFFINEFLRCSVREVLKVILIVEYKIINKNLQATKKSHCFLIKCTYTDLMLKNKK
jgi:hypothetical protein